MGEALITRRGGNEGAKVYEYSALHSSQNKEICNVPSNFCLVVSHSYGSSSSTYYTEMWECVDGALSFIYRFSNASPSTASRNEIIPTVNNGKLLITNDSTANCNLWVIK